MNVGKRCLKTVTKSSFLACNSYCVAPYVDIILHRGQLWAKSAASGSIRWCCFRSCCTVLSHVMRGRPGCLLQSAGGEDNRILLASALSSTKCHSFNQRDMIWIMVCSRFAAGDFHSFRMVKVTCLFVPISLLVDWILFELVASLRFY